VEMVAAVVDMAVAVQQQLPAQLLVAAVAVD
jgi:hypothetical protein